MLKLATRQQKAELFGRVKSLKGNEKYNGIRLSNDYGEDEMMGYREAKQIYNAAKLHTKDAKLRGTSVLIDGNIYTRDQFNDLPYMITKSQLQLSRRKTE